MSHVWLCSWSAGKAVMIQWLLSSWVQDHLQTGKVVLSVCGYLQCVCVYCVCVCVWLPPCTGFSIPRQKGCMWKLGTFTNLLGTISRCNLKKACKRVVLNMLSMGFSVPNRKGCRLNIGTATHLQCTTPRCNLKKACKRVVLNMPSMGFSVPNRKGCRLNMGTATHLQCTTPRCSLKKTCKKGSTQC